jgi:Mg2+ and Co2+ transporter CorA
MATDAGVRSVNDLREFGRQIQQMGEQMSNVMIQAQRRMNYVCEGWHDDMNDKFKTRFDESVRSIQKMSEEFKQYNEYLKRTCDILDAYKGNRLNI